MAIVVCHPMVVDPVAVVNQSCSVLSVLNIRLSLQLRCMKEP